MKSHKNKKGAGRDGIAYEMYKNNGEFKIDRMTDFTLKAEPVTRFVAVSVTVKSSKQ